MVKTKGTRLTMGVLLVLNTKQLNNHIVVFLMSSCNSCCSASVSGGATSSSSSSKSAGNRSLTVLPFGSRMV